jgi:putative ABC transport system substrate-binding protein
MKKTITVLTLCAMLFVLSIRVEAQQPMGKVPRIGILGAAASTSAFAGRIEAFRQGLRDLGYVEGKNISIESRWAEGKLDRLPDLAAALVREKMDVLVSAGGIRNAGSGKATTR